MRQPPLANPRRPHQRTQSSETSSGTKSRYSFTWSAGATGAFGNYLNYANTAQPLNPATGRQYFYTDQSGVIRFKLSAAASATDPPIR